MGKLKGAKELGYGTYPPAQDAALTAEAERNPFFSATIFKAATGFPGPKGTIISRLQTAGLRSKHAAMKELLTDEQTIPFSICCEQRRYHNPYGGYNPSQLQL
jgi:hypothetical protein